MFKKSLTAAVAALTLVGTVAASTQPAEARGIGRAVAFGTAGFAVGALAAGAAAAATRPYYAPAYYGYGYAGCGYVSRPVYNSWGYQVGWSSVPAC